MLLVFVQTIVNLFSKVGGLKLGKQVKHKGMQIKDGEKKIEIMQII